MDSISPHRVGSAHIFRVFHEHGRDYPFFYAADEFVENKLFVFEGNVENVYAASALG